MVNKHTVDYHPSPSQLISRIHTHISMDSLGVYLSRIFLEFFPKPVYSTMVVEKFQSYSVKIIAIHLWVKKLNLFIFNHAPKQNSPRFLSLSSRQTGIAHSSRTAFFEDIFFWGERGVENYGVKKNTKINKGIGRKFW